MLGSSTNSFSLVLEMSSNFSASFTLAVIMASWRKAAEIRLVGASIRALANLATTAASEPGSRVLAMVYETIARLVASCWMALSRAVFSAGVRIGGGVPAAAGRAATR